MDDEVQHQTPPSPIHHQGLPAIEPNLIVEDIARLWFPMAFLSENAYNIQ